MSANKGRLHFDRLPELSDRFVGPPSEIIELAVICIDNERERIDVLCLLNLGDSCFRSSCRDQIVSIAVMRNRVIGIQIDGALVFTLRSVPIPVVIKLAIRK